MNRRQLFCWTGMGLVAKAAGAAGIVPPQEKEEKAAAGSLPLEDYQPRSMLQVPETHVARAKYPVIDIHTHITDAAVD